MLPAFFPPPAMMMNGYSPTRYSPRVPPTAPLLPLSPDSSPAQSFSSHTPPRLDLESLSEHLLAGFQSSAHSDVKISFGDKLTFKLHGLIISRSLTLRRIIEQHPQPPRDFLVPLHDPFITRPGISIALSSLYSPAVLAEVPSHAQGVLAAASFLQLDELATLAADSCEAIIERSRRPQEFSQWFDFLRGAAAAIEAQDNVDVPSSEEEPAHPRTASDYSTPLFTRSKESKGRPSYGEQGARLWDVLLRRILQLPLVYGFEKGGKDVELGQQRMVQLLCVCPFSVVKHTLESSDLCCPGGYMGRFKLAKAVVAARKGRAEVEETVVLAFSAGINESPITVLQKTGRRPRLWKLLKSPRDELNAPNSKSELRLFVPPQPHPRLVSSPRTRGELSIACQATSYSTPRMSLRTAARHYGRRDDVLSQVSPVLDQYKGQLCHESTDFTHDDGRVELLLQLTGVLPVSIGAATYHCPIALWLPLDFPTKPPMVFVIPSATLAVKSGPNVDPSGRVSVPYLDNWTRKGEGCSLLSLINDYLIPMFSARYPVVTRQQQPTPAREPPPASLSSPAPPRPPPPPGTVGRPLSGADQLARSGSDARRESFGSDSHAPPRPPPPPGSAAGPQGPPRPVNGYGPPPPGYQSPPPLPPQQRPQSMHSPVQSPPPPRQPDTPASARPMSIGSQPGGPPRPPPPQGYPTIQTPPLPPVAALPNGHHGHPSSEGRGAPPVAPPAQPRPPSQSLTQGPPPPPPSQPQSPPQPFTPPFAGQPPPPPQSPLRQAQPPPHHQQQQQRRPPPPPSSTYSSHYEPTVRPDSRNSGYDAQSASYAPTTYAHSVDARSYAATSVDGRSYAPSYDGRSYAPTDRSATPPARASPPPGQRHSSGAYQPRQPAHAYQQHEMGQQFQPTLQQRPTPRDHHPAAVPAPPSSTASSALSDERRYYQQQQHQHLARASTLPAAAGHSRPHRTASTAQPRKPNLNILDSEPEDISSAETSPSSHHPPGSVSGTSSAPPPLPPNPALLALRTRLHSKLSLSLSALSSQTQQELQKMDMYEMDLLKGEPAILDEMQRLEVVRGVCENVRDRYKAVVEEGEKRLRDYEARGEGPEVDEIVCSSTVVYNQLLDLVTEDAALEDTIYHLGRGLNSDMANIDLDRFLKRVRGLAREQFQKRALVNKILLSLAARGQQRSGTPSAAGTV